MAHGKRHRKALHDERRATTMSPPTPKPPLAPSSTSRARERFPLPGERRLAHGILSRRILRPDDLAPLAWWQRRVTGYVSVFLLVALSIILVVHVQALVEPHFFAGATTIITVFIIALLWGAGPAIFATVLSTIALDYYVIAPTGTVQIWTNLLDYLPFIVTCLIVSLLAAQRERARRRARTAERLAVERAHELETANKLKDQFLSLASHELKTPITTIKGYAQLAERRLGSLGQDASPALASTRQVLDKITQQADRLTWLVNDLLDVSRIQAGKLELRQEQCDLAVLCRQAAEEHELTSGRMIDLSLPDGPIYVSGDSERLGQVLGNLLANAIKYSADGRPVRLTLACQAGKALVSVQDQGVGIPEDELPMIFERFFRARTARSGSQRGLGLGLAICKEIVERHHGRIWVESEEGKGSRFSFELPLAKKVA